MAFVHRTAFKHSLGRFFSLFALPPAIGGSVHALGITQIVCWGTTFYAPAVISDPIIAEMGWSRTEVFGAFSLSLILGALVSRPAGRALDRHGGRTLMAMGSAVCALGLLVLSLAPSLPVYLAGWLVLGVGMRLSLYEAAFATLTEIAGTEARRAISALTFYGGFASSVFWPLGWALASWVGWRGALVIFAALNLMVCLPLHLWCLPARKPRATKAASPGSTNGDSGRLEGTLRRLAMVAFTLAFALMTYVNSALSAHIIDTLVAMGLSGKEAVSVASLRGFGQVGARVSEFLFAAGLDPVWLAIIAVGLTPLALVVLFLGGGFVIATVFSLGQGASNGLVTIARGAAPLVVFGAEGYGQLLGTMAGPALIASAVAPLVHAAVIDRWGHGAALWSMLLVALAALSALAVLAAALRGARRGR
ncbi:MAG: MFS transporter [Proteobacteria bacterium]|nr:MFS transporter [Pseudomonadota bacterium]